MAANGSHKPDIMDAAAEDTLWLLDVEQAAALLNVSVRFVRRLIAERRIAVHRIGRHVRLTRADLEAYVAQGRSDPLPPRAAGSHR